MTPIAITGWSALCAAGRGRASLTRAFADLSAAASGGQPVTSMYSDPLPSPSAYAMSDFDPRRALGKGSSFIERGTALALIACGEALADSGVTIDDGNRRRVGVTLGTTLGSLKSMSDYTRETLVEKRPYRVNPALFPTTVMNCAAGQAAIRYGLQGVNATLAGGPLAFVSALRYARNALDRGYADALLCGAVEEFTPHTAWAARLCGGPQAAQAVGEAAAVFLLERSDKATAAGRAILAEIVAVTAGFSCEPSRHAQRAALIACIERALRNAGARSEDVVACAPGAPERPGVEGLEVDALSQVFGPGRLDLLFVDRAVGDCQAASGALQLAALVSQDARPNGQLSIVTGCSRDGGVGAAVVRSSAHVGVDRS
jgi:3-oxoacyl-[acyl-carrier-protein] synthase II